MNKKLVPVKITIDEVVDGVLDEHGVKDLTQNLTTVVNDIFDRLLRDKIVGLNLGDSIIENALRTYIYAREGMGFYIFLPNSNIHDGDKEDIVLVSEEYEWLNQE